MAIEVLKSSKTEVEKAKDESKIRSVVEESLSFIEKDGDEAVRSLTNKFDSCCPERFQLTPSEIQAAVQKVSDQDMKDIKFAQEQIPLLSR